ncbi:MAG: hypothetical protein ACYDDI_02520 [Candidatus Acidiferrales bacterium]
MASQRTARNHGITAPASLVFALLATAGVLEQNGARIEGQLLFWGAGTFYNVIVKGHNQ